MLADHVRGVCQSAWCEAKAVFMASHFKFKLAAQRQSLSHANVSNDSFLAKIIDLLGCGDA